MTSNCFAEGPDYTVLLLPEPVGFGLGGRGVFFWGGGVWGVLIGLSVVSGVCYKNSQNADL